MTDETASGTDQSSLSRKRFLLWVLMISLLFLSRSRGGAAPSDSSSQSSPKVISEGEYPDQPGREALRLWSDRENIREFEKAARIYRDYWTVYQTKYVSAYQLWLKMEMTQQWLKDPENNPLPPPPPPLILPGSGDLPPIPYMYYPPPWFFAPWYSLPYFTPSREKATEREE